MDYAQMQAVALLANGVNPGLAVFDLDWTIWPYDCGCEVLPPFRTMPWGIVDGRGYSANPYKDVRGIMAALVDAGVPIAIASRNPDMAVLESLLRLITFECGRGTISIWDALPSPAYFRAHSSGGLKGKANHFAALKEASGVDYDQMLFFDDLPENIYYAKKQGITSVSVAGRGLTWWGLGDGLVAYKQARAIASVATASTASVATVSTVVAAATVDANTVAI